ncbi:MAG TPA: hypothetical protein VE401_12155 [Solirubrobacterales bacterium]|nr:hypothetical protein [Solirubrobacterales bacterium]
MTAKPAERIKTLPITAKAGADRRIVMRLGPREAGLKPLPDLLPGDELKVLVELAVTTDCRSVQQGDCVEQPYRFSPRVRARVLLADNPNATARRKGHALLLHEETATVSQEQHHHVFVLEPPPVEIPTDWDADQNYVIVALDASNRYAKRRQVLLIGANEKGDVQQDMARISVARRRSGNDPPPQAAIERRLRTDRLPLTKEKRVVFSAPMAKLAKDEQLVVGAMVEVSGRGIPYKARISTRLVLADGPAETDAGKEARKVDALKGEIAEHNGTNCLSGATQRARKVGMSRVTRNAGRTHYVNLVAESADPVAGRTDRSLTLVRGSLAVTRYPASWKG